MSRPPDLTSKDGRIRIWRGLTPSAAAYEKNPDWQAGLLSWLVQTDPGVFSPMCTHWWGGLVTLSDTPGVAPAHRQFAGADYELSWFAVNPEIERDWVAFYDERAQGGIDDAPGHLLTPPEIVFQWGGTTDEQALQVAEALLRGIAAGENIDSPVQYGDLVVAAWRRAWKTMLTNTVAHVRSDHWPVTEGLA